ncbi:hypothetical protein ACQ4PT_008691 [Festuca glaucescens]
MFEDAMEGSPAAWALPVPWSEDEVTGGHRGMMVLPRIISGRKIIDADAASTVHASFRHGTISRAQDVFLLLPLYRWSKKGLDDMEQGILALGHSELRGCYRERAGFLLDLLFAGILGHYSDALTIFKSSISGGSGSGVIKEIVRRAADCDHADVAGRRQRKTPAACAMDYRAVVTGGISTGWRCNGKGFAQNSDQRRRSAASPAAGRSSPISHHALLSPRLVAVLSRDLVTHDLVSAQLSDTRNGARSNSSQNLKPPPQCSHPSSASQPLPPHAMAPSPPAPLLLLLALSGLAVAAAQLPFPPPPPQQQPTNASDADALRAVFKQWGLGYGGPVTAEDPCRKRFWFQSFAMNASINCSCGDSTLPCRISHLNVTGYRNLTDIPPALFNLTELVSLDLSNNNLSGQIPPGIANLTKLETWHFNNNQLSGPFPNGSSGLRSLQSLWMFDNYIEGTLPEFLANFTNLTDLRIYGMKLQGPIPKKFSNLIKLEKLMLGDLDGGNSTFDFIANWTNLSTLDLGSNNISGSVELLLQHKNSSLYLGGNNFSGNLPSEMVQSSRPLDVSYNPLLIGILPDNPAGQKWSINYIGTSIGASRTTNSENLTLLNCLHMKGCNRTFYNNLITSCAVNCGGKQTTYPDSLSNTFYDDTSDLGAAGFHVNSDRQWVVSNVGSDPLTLGNSPGIVNAGQVNLGTDLPELYRTARTSRSDLWYYVVGLSNGKYTVQLFFAEIVIESELNRGPGRRSFNIDIQDRNIKTDFDITKEAGGFGRPTNITHEATVDNSVLKIHLYWNGRGTRAIPYEGAYGPLVSAIRVFLPEIPPNNSPAPARPEAAPHDNKRRGVVAGIAALCIAVAVISSSVVYLWWKWVSLVKHSNT